jgi:hypothetical protein
VTYEVAWTPAVPGLEYLTGDGSDLQGGTLPTEAAYATPFEPSARLGPVCMLRAEAVTPTCSARAIIGGNLFICEGEDVVLDATGSSLTGCPGVLEHRWLRDGVELFAFPGPPTLSDAPLTDAVYELEIRCDVAPSCSDSSAVTVRVEPDVAPGPVGDSLRVNEVPGGYLFTWSVNGARSYNLWRDVDPLLPIATRTLVANVPAGSHLLPPAPRVRYRVDYYLVFAASCAGTEGP